MYRTFIITSGNDISIVNVMDDIENGVRNVNMEVTFFDRINHQKCISDTAGFLK